MLLLLLLAVVLGFYYIGTKNYNYWKNKCVKFEKPVVFFGNILMQFTQKMSQSDVLKNLYRQNPNDKYIGLYIGSTPVLLIRDPDLIKHVLVTDFKNFHYRGIHFAKNDSDLLSKNIFLAEGDQWKLMRQKLTPAFSTGKLKAMFPLIVAVANNLHKASEDICLSGEEVNILELMSRYSTDVIGACGFGIDCDTINNEKSEFRGIVKELFMITPKRIVIAFLTQTFPNTFTIFRQCSKKVENFILSLVKQIMSQRNYKSSGRNDFIDIALKLRERGNIVGASIEKFNTDGSPKTVEIILDDALLTAHIFVLFAAGYEATSLASSILLHVLAYHPDEQARCQQDIDKALTKHNGKLSHESIKEMKYLEMAMKESLRISPPLPIMTRKCVKKCTFPGTNLTIDEGVIVVISLEALHLDEKYFKDPEEFRPQRFCQPEVDPRENSVYMPFGDGPRACIGERLGIMQVMAGVATILSKFTVVPSKNSNRWPRMNRYSGLTRAIDGGLPLHLKLRK